jgi:hypothetical protein
MDEEKRRNPRIAGYAKAIVAGTMTPGYIRDLSRTGCQVSFLQPIELSSGSLLNMEVIAEHDPTIAPFRLSIRVRWMNKDSLWHFVGGEIETLSCREDDECFARLVEYYERGG